MSKIDKFALFKGAMAMSGQERIWDSDMGKHYASYLVLTKLIEVGDQFSLSDAVEIEMEAEEWKKEFDKQNDGQD